MLFLTKYAYAKTILILLISNTNVLTEVVGISKTSTGPISRFPVPLYIRYVPISEAKNIQSDPKNTHISNFLLSIPVVVSSDIFKFLQ